MSKAFGRFGVLWVLVCSLWANLSWAQAVDIVWAASDTGQTLETATRLRGEILAMGITFVRVDERPSPSADGQTPRHAVGPNPIDAPGRVWIDVSATDELLLVEVWFLEEQQPPSLVATLMELKTTPNAPEKLAIRGAEALHSRLVERDWLPKENNTPNETKTKPQELPATQVRDDVEAEVSPHRELHRPGLSLGAAMLNGESLSPAFLPRLQMEWLGTSWFRWTASIAGLGSPSKANTERGTALLSRHYALIGGSFQTAMSFLRPFIGISVGAMLCSIEGQADAPLRTHAVQRVVGLGELSVGSHLDFSGSYYFTLAGHVHFARPGVAIYVVDELAATAGNPTWGASLALGARL